MRLSSDAPDKSVYVLFNLVISECRRAADENVRARLSEERCVLRVHAPIDAEPDVKPRRHDHLLCLSQLFIDGLFEPLPAVAGLNAHHVQKIYIRQDIADALHAVCRPYADSDFLPRGVYHIYKVYGIHARIELESHYVRRGLFKNAEEPVRSVRLQVD